MKDRQKVETIIRKLKELELSTKNNREYIRARIILERFLNDD